MSPALLPRANLWRDAGRSLPAGLTLLATAVAGLGVGSIGPRPVLLAVAGVLAGAAALAMVRRPLLGALVLGLLLSAFPIARVEIGPLPIYLADLLVGITLVGVVWRGLAPGRFGGAVLLYLALWLPAWLVQVLTIQIVLEPTYGLLRQVLAVGCAFIGMAVVRQRGVSRLVGAFAIGTLATSALAVVQELPLSREAVRELLLAIAPAFAPGGYLVYPERAFALFQAPTTLSGFLAVMVPLLVGAADHAGGRLRLLALAALLGVGPALVASYSRQWLPALALGLAVMGVLRPGLLGRFLLAAAIGGGVAWWALGNGALDPSYLERRFGGLAQPAEDRNIMVRIERQVAFLSLASTQPVETLVGRGFAGQDLEARGVVDELTAEYLRTGFNDNVFLLEVWNHGVGAGIVYVLLLGTALRAAVLAARRPGPDRGILAGLAASLATATVLHLFDNYFSEAVFMKALFWLLVGLAVASAPAESWSLAPGSRPQAAGRGR